MDHYVFPCIISYSEEDKIFYVNFLDIEEAFTDGENYLEALNNGKDVLGAVLYEYEKLGRTIPNPTTQLIKTNENEIVSYVEVWMPLYREELDNKSVNKTVTIPKWLNDLAENKNVNFSKILQIGLKNELLSKK